MKKLKFKRLLKQQPALAVRGNSATLNEIKKLFVHAGYRINGQSLANLKNLNNSVGIFAYTVKEKHEVFFTENPYDIHCPIYLVSQFRKEPKRS